MKNGWEIKKLGDVATLQRGFDLPTQHRVDGEFPLISSSGISDTHHKSAVRGPGVVTGRSGSIGNVFFIEHDFWPLNTVLYVKNFHGNDPRFVHYLLKNFDLKRFASGSGVPTLNRNFVHDELVSVPPLPEQQRVVGILDQALESIAAAKASAEKNLQNARALFESHLQSVFTQRGKGLVETTLGRVCEFVGGSQPPKSVFSRTKNADNVRLIQIRDYKSNKHVVYIPCAQARRFCEENDVMIGRYGPPLFQILRGLKGAYNVALMKAVPDESKLTRDFLFYFLRHSTILQYVIYHSERAAGQIGITKETLEFYPIALPSLNNQEKIVETITQLETETQRFADLYERRLAALEALKKSLLNQAFTGEL
jgi:type I restriction enzyme, S subunit